MRYRSRTDIVAQILQAVVDNDVNAHRGTTKTRIMFKAFLSYGQLKEYLAMLLENGLLDYDSRTKTYKITGRGKRFLIMYNQIDEAINCDHNF
jgi:predicted transcriptional regulator